MRIRSLLLFNADSDPNPDPTFRSDADPDPTFQFDVDPAPTTQFFPDLDPPLLQNNPLRLSTFHFDADPPLFTLMQIQLPKTVAFCIFCSVNFCGTVLFSQRFIAVLSEPAKYFAYGFVERKQANSV
jgi:hypothetical protein